MITNEDIQNLAALSRIEVEEGEVSAIRKKMEGVLAYVSDVRNIAKEEALSETPNAGEHRNVFREDKEPHEEEKYTEIIIKNAPEKEGNYIKVRKIL